MNLPYLSELERGILARSTELGVVPYEDTPRKRVKNADGASQPQPASEAADDGAPASGSSPTTPPPAPTQRVGSTEWCERGRYTAMPTSRKGLCSRELPQAVRKQPTRCITLNDDFAKLCLDAAVLAVACCEVREKGREPHHELYE